MIQQSEMFCHAQDFLKRCHTCPIEALDAAYSASAKVVYDNDPDDEDEDGDWDILYTDVVNDQK